MNAKESDLDGLKTLGDDIVRHGRSSVVEPFEKQIYKRWDELEKKLETSDSMLQMKLKEIEKQEQQQADIRHQVAQDEVKTNKHVVKNTSTFC